MKHSATDSSATPVDPLGSATWYLHESHFDPAACNSRESLFALGNGQLGVRGNFEEAYPQGVATIPGTYWNGLYVRRPIAYGENAPGFPQQADFMPAILDARRLDLQLNGQALNQAKIIAHQRWLEFGPGHSRRCTRWRDKAGAELELWVESWVSQAQPGLLSQRIELRAPSQSVTLELSATLAPTQLDLAHDDDPRISAGAQDQLHYCAPWSEAETGLLGASQTGANLRIDVVVALSLYPAQEEQNPVHGEWSVAEVPPQGLALAQSFSLAAGQGIILERLALYQARPLDRSAPATTDPALAQLRQQILSLRGQGYQHLQRQHQTDWAQFWQTSDFALPGQERLEQGLRFNLFQLRQSCARPEANRVGAASLANIAAKGLSGPGYDGHFFWDSEIYVLPLFSLLEPTRAQALLRYRTAKLAQARQRAREMSHPQGALFPWRTISGDECSAFFPAGTAQYHINADIAYALWRYARDSGDWDFACGEAAEMLLETARIWLDLGHFNPQQGQQFTLHEVTGPDEYSAMVDNNFYTNVLAARHLSFAADIADLLAEKHPERWQMLRQRIDICTEETRLWRQAAEHIFLPEDTERDLSWQDDRFAQRPAWDYQRHPSDQRPLLLKHHPLVLYRHQILKQADVLMAHYLCPEHSSLQRKANDFAFYEPLTTHDSSLSPCVHSIIAAWTGQSEIALNYLWQAVRSDLDDLHSNASHGLHIAAMAGSLACLYQGFAGLQLLHGTHPAAQTPFTVGTALDCLRLAPTLPPSWSGYRLRFQQADLLLELLVQAGDSQHPHTELRLLEQRVPVAATFVTEEAELAAPTVGNPLASFALFVHGLATPVNDARAEYRAEQTRLHNAWNARDWAYWRQSGGVN